MSDKKPPLGVEPYYVNTSIRVRDLCSAIYRQVQDCEPDHNKIKLWCKEIMFLNEMDRTLRYEEKQKVWSEDKSGMLHEML